MEFLNSDYPNHSEKEINGIRQLEWKSDHMVIGKIHTVDELLVTGLMQHLLELVQGFLFYEYTRRELKWSLLSQRVFDPN